MESSQGDEVLGTGIVGGVLTISTMRCEGKVELEIISDVLLPRLLVNNTLLSS